MIMNAAERAGYKTLDANGKFIPGDEGCEGYLLWVALNDHKTYCALLARILPYYVTPELPQQILTLHTLLLFHRGQRGDLARRVERGAGNAL